jgi:phospholipid-binding lipoprotein MlaA
MARPDATFRMLALGLFLAGCAGTRDAAPADPDDPYETTNREIFTTNLKLDEDFLLPAARTYNRVVPAFARERMHDFLVNLDLPNTFANDLLQGEPKRAGQTVSRFMVNSTIGLGGLFDPATHFDMPSHSEDFGQTLGVWGVGQDPYLMLPVLGPSSPRDLVGKGVDIAMDPLTWIPFKQHIWWLGARQYMRVLDVRARNIDTLQDIERGSLDPYASARSLYRQYRENEIHNGAVPPKEKLPDL